MKFYFFIIRFYAILIMIIFLIDFEMFFTTYNFFLFHVFSGLLSILNDYIHLKKLKIFLIFFSKVLFLSITSIILEINF